MNEHPTTSAASASGASPGKASRLQAVRGMNDVLPDDAPLWEYFEDTARSVFAQYGYRNIRVPIVEPTALFVRGIGEYTDVVEKEMYSFEDKLNGESLTLRPEATSGIVRAALEHDLLYQRPQRVWTTGPMFRHERPQKGRYRQFHQMDAEALGYAGPDVDAEQIVMLARLWRVLGLTGIGLRINSIGNAGERAAHRRALVAYFERHADLLDADARRRLHANPLRILDSKNPALQSMLAAAPKLIDFIEDDSRAHFEALQRHLVDAGLDFTIDARLVRGLDYYNRTVFEWIDDSGALGAQGTVAGGGRYDALFEILGGKPSFACGFAIGIERMILLLAAVGVRAAPAPVAYVVHTGDAAGVLARAVAEQARDAGMALVVNAGGGSMKAQMKRADASGAAYALIIGDDEVHAAAVAIKPLRGGGEQFAVPVNDAAARLAALTR
ncbi:MAG: histidine--tRNA ligase [Burkholderiales bacterium]|nr:histidine--tRNA ligase [Burkholderiales bacterium]